LIRNTNIEINLFVLLKVRWMVLDHVSHARMDKMADLWIRLRPDPRGPQLPDDRKFDSFSWANPLSCKSMYLTRPPVTTVYIFNNEALVKREAAKAACADGRDRDGLFRRG
jgi:hypothetical protein